MSNSVKSPNVTHAQPPAGKGEAADTTYPSSSSAIIISFLPYPYHAFFIIVTQLHKTFSRPSTNKTFRSAISRQPNYPSLCMSSTSSCALSEINNSEKQQLTLKT